MSGWQRHMQSVLRRGGKRMEYGYNASTSFSTSRLESSLVTGELSSYLRKLVRSPSSNISSSPYIQVYSTLGYFKRRISYHSKGRCGVKMRPKCQLMNVMREMTPEEEAKLANLRVHNFRKLTKKERRTVPHQLIETK